jgi:hypothetical protein
MMRGEQTSDRLPDFHSLLGVLGDSVVKIELLDPARSIFSDLTFADRAIA